jgi:CelD/BcsL family acetyltransferase involved in cellulose biosynthesis
MAADARLAAARSHPAAAPFETQWVTAPEALERLAPEWSELLREAPDASPFQSPEWLLAWRRRFLAEGLRAIALRRGQRLAALAPFFVYRDAAGRRQLTLLGNGLSDRLDVVCAPQDRPAVAAALGAALRASAAWDVCDFRDLPEGSPLLAVDLGSVRRESLEPEEPCPELALPADPDAVGADLPRSRRTDLRRCARRLAETGEVSVTRAGAADLDEHLEALRRLHGARWRARGEAGVLAEDEVMAFHRQAAAALLARGWLRLQALRLDGRIIAAHYAMHRGARACSYLHAFDPAFAALGPGWLLMAESLRGAVREGVRVFDFLRGREPYKYAWGAKDRPQQRRRVWR